MLLTRPAAGPVQPDAEHGQTLLPRKNFPTTVPLPKSYNHKQEGVPQRRPCVATNTTCVGWLRFNDTDGGTHVILPFRPRQVFHSTLAFWREADRLHDALQVIGA